MKIFIMIACSIVSLNFIALNAHADFKKWSNADKREIILQLDSLRPFVSKGSWKYSFEVLINALKNNSKNINKGYERTKDELVYLVNIRAFTDTVGDLLIKYFDANQSSVKACQNYVKSDYPEILEDLELCKIIQN
ncbi:MAG: hypothetical protein ACOYL6_14385 [Bacteriovoracaceae bacterium]